MFFNPNSRAIPIYTLLPQHSPGCLHVHTHGNMQTQMLLTPNLRAIPIHIHTTNALYVYCARHSHILAHTHVSSMQPRRCCSASTSALANLEYTYLSPTCVCYWSVRMRVCLCALVLMHDARNITKTPSVNQFLACSF